MRVGLLGGTFDPIHNGHIGLADNIIQRKLVDKIIFIPAALPPHKVDLPITSFYHRKNMIKLAIKGKEYFAISDIEKERVPLPSYTYDTFKWFSKNSPQDDFYLIIGEDSLLQIHKWHRANELIQECQIITYPRKCGTLTLEELKKYWPEKIEKKLLQTILSFPMYNMSATCIRKSANKSSELTLLLPPDIISYIKQNALYA